MKRLYTLLILFSFFALGSYAQSSVDESMDPAIAQFMDSTTAVSTNQAKKADSFRDHWTLGLKGGFNYFLLTKEQASPKTANGDNYGVASDMSHQFAIFSEYSFDYGVGLGAYLGNYSYNRQAVIGTSIEFGIYAHLNLLECFTWGKTPPIARRFHLFWDAGIGAGALWQLNQIPDDASSDTVFWMGAGVLRTAIQFEFMVRPNWGLMLEGEYHGYGRGNRTLDGSIHAAPWINAFMVSAGVRYYFDTREKEKDPRLDEDGFPIRKPHDHKPAPKNAVYINVSVTPEMLEEAYRSGGAFNAEASEMGGISNNVQVTPLPRSNNDVKSALKVLETQGVGTVLINSIRFSGDQLTDEGMQMLDEVAGSLLTNRMWQKVDMLYMSDRQATTRAAVIAAYLRAKGVKNLSVNGYDTQANDMTSDLIITIK